MDAAPTALAVNPATKRQGRADGWVQQSVAEL